MTQYSFHAHSGASGSDPGASGSDLVSGSVGVQGASGSDLAGRSVGADLEERRGQT